MQKIALRMLWADTGKSLAMVLGIAFSTLLMAQQAAIFFCLMNNTASHITAAQDVDVWVSDPRSDYFDDPGSLPQGLLNSVRSVEGVEYAVPFIRGQVTVDSPNFVEQAILIGIDPITKLGAPQKMIEGSLDALKASNVFAVDKRGYSDIWPNEDIVLGRFLEVNNHRLKLVAVVDPPSPFISMPLIYTGFTTAYGVTGNQRPSFILVRITDGQNAVGLSAAIAERTGYVAQPSDDFAKSTVAYYMKNTGIPINFFITIVLGFVVGLAVVAQTFYLFITENIKNLGVMKAMGATGWQLTQMTLLQCALVAGIGFSIGIAGAAWFFETVPNSVTAFKGFYLPWEVYLNTAIAILGISLFAGLISIQRAIRYAPAEVLR